MSGKVKTVKAAELHDTPWSCACGAYGIMRLPENFNGATWFANMIEIHRLSAPKCKLKEIGIGDWREVKPGKRKP